MKPVISTHLSEEALDDVLIGMGSEAAHTHLARCVECRTRVEQFGADVHLFNQASIAWSEAQPARRIVQARGARLRRPPLALAGAVAIAVLTVAVVVPIWQHEHFIAGNGRLPAEHPVQESQAQIAEDNDLMEAVNAAINPTEPSPVDEFGIAEKPKPHGKVHPKRGMR